MSNTGGISSVRSINDPVFKRALGMNRGGPVGDLSAPPPTKAPPMPQPRFYEQATMEETVIPSEPRVNPTYDTGAIFPMPSIQGPMSSEPGVMNIPQMDRAPEGTVMQDMMMKGRVLDPRDIYPEDPDPSFVLPPGVRPKTGILQITKVYDI
jgi:hypothetical protein